MVISYNFCPGHFQSYIYRDREKSAWKFGGLTLSVCPSAARVVLCLPLAQQIQSQMYLTTVSGIGGVFFHEDTRWDLNFYFLINIFIFFLLFWLFYTLLIYHSTSLTSTHLYSVEWCFPQSSNFVGPFLAWTGHKYLMPKMLTLAELCFKKNQLWEKYQPVTQYYTGLDRGSYCMRSQALWNPFFISCNIWWEKLPD